MNKKQIESQMKIASEVKMPNGNYVLFFNCHQKKHLHYFIIMNESQQKILEVGYTTLAGEVNKVWELTKN